MSIERLHFIQSQIRKAEADLSERNSTIKALQARLDMLRAWEKDEKVGVCATCNGYGKIREWHAQDHSELVTCDHCDGSGKAKTP